VTGFVTFLTHLIVVTDSKMVLFDFVTTIKEDIMRGGKREGAGRKGNKTTKVYRLPIELEPHIMELLNKHKNNSLNSVTESKDRVKPSLIKPTQPNSEQIKRLQIWLEVHEFVKNQTEARKVTTNYLLIKKKALDYSEATKKQALERGYNINAYNWSIQDIINLYSDKNE
jgi:hypothetical protein